MLAVILALVLVALLLKPLLLLHVLFPIPPLLEEDRRDNEMRRFRSCADTNTLGGSGSEIDVEFGFDGGLCNDSDADTDADDDS